MYVLNLVLIQKNIFFEKHGRNFVFNMPPMTIEKTVGCKVELQEWLRSC